MNETEALYQLNMQLLSKVFRQHFNIVWKFNDMAIVEYI